jgi:hypothetical protein
MVYTGTITAGTGIACCFSTGLSPECMFRKAGITEANSAFNMWSDDRYPAAAPTLADFLNWRPSYETQDPTTTACSTFMFRLAESKDSKPMLRTTELSVQAEIVPSTWGGRLGQGRHHRIQQRLQHVVR